MKLSKTAVDLVGFSVSFTLWGWEFTFTVGVKAEKKETIS